jgi:hypothetical protein
MKAIATTRSLAIAQAGMRRDLKGMFGHMSRDLSGLVTRGVSVQNGTRILAQASQITLSYFVGADGRSAYGSDGVTALAAYPRILNRWTVYASRSVVYSHRDWLKRNAPQDVYAWLSGGRRLREITGEKRWVFQTPQAWVDPNGLALSDRIWQNALRTAQKVDALIADAIRSGRSASDLARDLEGFLLPGRLGRRTDRPYGRDGSADAMRLSRTEISHAHGQISYVAALMNPYVDRWDWALSPAHPKMDVCDGLATIGEGGERLREPYPLADAPIPPVHPYCLCNGRGAVVEDPAAVTAKLRQQMADGDEPPVNPAQGDAFLSLLLGALIAAELIERLAA